MSTSRILKWTTGAFEAVLGVPILGAAIIIGFLWFPLVIMLVLHITTLVLTIKDKGATTGSILGIITSCIGWIPFVGMVMHIVSAIFLMIDGAKTDKTSKEYL
ncbi:hypothetical protein CN378_12950 [Bacillus sp. AFS015802]|uniref:hypothetical protein n=1 Tax=Bacillus sp. AFS015802 TaxID=2033486 RepID=UPI000BFA72AA|nr:hypothetical protein [Bacillus sp. AFS015802]PFA66820.1 hypothetical protein CN378_12950 [Bacillus sp. AFS015802]